MLNRHLVFLWVLLAGALPAAAKVVITKQPQQPPGTVAVGSSFELQVAADGKGPLTYQWRRNGVNIPGETSAVLSFGKSFPLTGGGLYSVVVADAESSLRSQKVDVVPGLEPLPFSDDFSTEKNVILPSDLGAGLGDNSKATVQRAAGEPFHDGQFGGASLWIQWQPTKSGIAVFSTIGSDFDTLLAAYQVAAGDKPDLRTLVKVASNDESGLYHTSLIRFNATAGRTYFIAVDGDGSLGSPTGRGHVTFAWGITASTFDLPVLNFFPADANHKTDTEVSLGIDFNPDPKAESTVQWFRNGQLIDGETKGIIAIKPLTKATVGRYFARIRRAAGGQVEFVDSPPADIQIYARSNETDNGVLARDRFLRSKLDFGGAGGGAKASFGRRPLALARGVSGTQIFHTAGAVTEEDEPLICGIPGGASEWYALLASEGGTVVVDTVGSDFDTLLGCFADSGAGSGGFDSLVEVACNNDAGPGISASRIAFVASAGVPYSVVMDGVGGGSGAVVLNYSMYAPLSITGQPASLTLNPGQPAVFNVVADGYVTSYQWLKNSVAIAGQTGTSLMLASVSAGDAATYSVMVGNGAGESVVSAGAVLTVRTPPSISGQPASLTVNPGASAAFTATATGSPTLTYQWRKDTVNLPGQTAATLTLNAVTAADGASYDCVVTNPAGSATSNAAVLTVRTPPSIAVGPVVHTVTYDFTADPIVAGVIEVGGNGVNDVPYQPSGGNPGGFLGLTYPVGSLFTSVVFDNIDNGKIVSAFNFKADLRVGNSTGDRPADGFSISFARSNDPVLASADAKNNMGNWAGGVAEGGTTTGIVVDFDTWSGNVLPDGPDVEGLIVRVDNVTILRHAMPTRHGSATDATSIQTGPRDGNAASSPDSISWATLSWVPLEIDLDAVGKLTVKFKNTILVESVPTAFVPGAGQIVLAGRTGGANEHTHFDNIMFTTQSADGLLDRTVNPGQSTVFTVTATGSPTLTYQWRKDAVNLPGQTAATLNIAAAAVSDAGSYDCVVTNPAGSATSSAAVLTVRTSPSLTAQPTGLTVNPGASAAFTVTASGSPTLTYQWRKDAVNLPSQTAATLSIASAVAGDAGSYDCVVTNPAGSSTSAAAVLTVRTLPSITSQPVSQTVVQGGPVTFSVTASGSPTLTYQWQKDGSPIPGATGDSYGLATVTVADAGAYSVVVTNPAGNATSAAATLTVHVPPSITGHPASLIVNQNAAAAFTVTATGTPAPNYQWRKGEVNLPGQTTATLSLVSAQPADEGSYDCVVSNAAGSAISNPAMLAVRIPPTVTGQPASLTVNPNQPASFTVTANGSPTPSYQWRKNAVNLPGQTAATLSIALALAGDAGNYDCVVTNPAGSATSAAAVLTVRTLPSITGQPTGLTVNPGASAVFTVTATGSPTLTYQWRKNSVNLAGQTAATLSIASAVAGDAGSYDCVVTNPAGSATSSAAVLTVRTLPGITGQPTGLTVNPGASAVFTVTATGSPTLTYQWRKNSVNLAGQTAATLSIASAVAGDAGSYDCVVTNPAGSATSSAAVLTVRTLPGITGQPTGLTVNPGASAAFTVAATGSPTLTYQWRKDTVNLPGQTAATLNIAAAAASDAGSYDCIVTNPAGSATSSAAVLTVRTLPSITGQPAGLTVNPGASAAFTVTASGSPTLTYQWRKNSVNLAGQTAATLSIASAVAGDAGSYDCVVTNPAGSATSAAAVLTVRTPPSISSHPASLTRVVGQTATFTVVATGTAPLSYQWQKNTVDILGATSASHTIAAVTSDDAGSYRVVVSNPAGSATSVAATLTVGTPSASVFTLFGLLPDGRLHLRLQGTPGLAHAIQSSPDFSVWTDVVSGSPADGLLNYTSPAPISGPGLMYRGVGP